VFLPDGQVMDGAPIRAVVDALQSASALARSERSQPISAF
jgi:hypothetical protein